MSIDALRSVFESNELTVQAVKRHAVEDAKRGSPGPTEITSKRLEQYVQGGEKVIADSLHRPASARIQPYLDGKLKDEEQQLMTDLVQKQRAKVNAHAQFWERYSRKPEETDLLPLFLPLKTEKHPPFYPLTPA